MHRESLQRNENNKWINHSYIEVDETVDLF